MRIQGIESVREHDVFHLPRRDGTVIDIPIQSVLSADSNRIQNELPPPVVPTEVVMRNGKPLKDENGRIVREPREDKAEYLSEVATRGARLMVAWIVYGTAWNQNIALDTDLGSASSDPKAFYSRVLAELSAFGFSSGDLQEWSIAIMKLSTPQREEVVAAKESFRDEGETD